MRPVPTRCSRGSSTTRRCSRPATPRWRSRWPSTRGYRSAPWYAGVGPFLCPASRVDELRGAAARRRSDIRVVAGQRRRRCRSAARPRRCAPADDARWPGVETAARPARRGPAPSARTLARLPSRRLPRGAADRVRRARSTWSATAGCPAPPSTAPAASRPRPSRPSASWPPSWWPARRAASPFKLTAGLHHAVRSHDRRRASSSTASSTCWSPPGSPQTGGLGRRRGRPRWPSAAPIRWSGCVGLGRRTCTGVRAGVPVVRLLRRDRPARRPRPRSACWRTAREHDLGRGARRARRSRRQNLPYGVFSSDGEAPRVRGRARRPRARPRAACRRRGAGRRARVRVAVAEPVPGAGPAGLDRRCGRWLVELLEHEGYRRAGREPPGAAVAEVTLQLPFEVADYVDFYSSQHHAENVGRDLPARRRRAARPTGSTCRSATTAGPARSWSPAPTSCGRSGQRKPPDADRPVVRARRSRLDIEAEVGFVVGVPSPLGEPVPTADFRRARLRRRAWSTTGAPATSRPGSTCRSGRSSASRSRRRCRRGSCRWTRCARPGCRRPVQDPPVLPLPASDEADWGLDLSLEVALERRRSCPGRRSPACTGRRTSSWPT